MSTKNKIVAAAGTAIATVAGSASAALDVGVTTAIETAGTDVATIGAAVLLVLVAVAGFKYLKKPL